jgi:hypothetical protein
MLGNMRIEKILDSSDLTIYLYVISCLAGDFQLADSPPS